MEIITFVEVYPAPSLFKNTSVIDDVEIVAVAVVVIAVPTRLRVVMYPSSSTVLSTSSILVSISSFSYS